MAGMMTAVIGYDSRWSARQIDQAECPHGQRGAGKSHSSRKTEHRVEEHERWLGGWYRGGVGGKSPVGSTKSAQTSVMSDSFSGFCVDAERAHFDSRIDTAHSDQRERGMLLHHCCQ